MATINAIAREWADEIRGGIAWVIVWKTGRSWNAQAVWLNCDDDTFEPGDLDLAREILKKDPEAVMLNGYYCGHFGEDMTVAELAAGIRWHYENGYNLLKDSMAFPPEPMERPADLPANLPWYGKTTNAGADPYVYDGYMSLEDIELMHKHMEADREQEEDANAAGKAWTRLKQAAEAAGKVMTRLVGKYLDAMLYQANDNPKWWHYFKYARKYRVRKKYRRRLERQLLDKLSFYC